PSHEQAGAEPSLTPRPAQAGSEDASDAGPVRRERARRTADLSEPKVFNHLLKATLFGLLALAPVSGFVALLLEGHTEGFTTVLFLVGWPLLCGCTRNVHALLARPHFRITLEGVEILSWVSVDFP